MTGDEEIQSARDVLALWRSNPEGSHPGPKTVDTLNRALDALAREPTLKEQLEIAYQSRNEAMKLPNRLEWHTVPALEAHLARVQELLGRWDREHEQLCSTREELRRALCGEPKKEDCP